jgi:hypothetical protein
MTLHDLFPLLTDPEMNVRLALETDTRLRLHVERALAAHRRH